MRDSGERKHEKMCELKKEDILKEFDLLQLDPEQMACLGLECAMEVCKEGKWQRWAASCLDDHSFSGYSANLAWEWVWQKGLEAEDERALMVAANACSAVLAYRAILDDVAVNASNTLLRNIVSTIIVDGCALASAEVVAARRKFVLELYQH